MKILVAGLGSIGQRHVKNLRALHPDVEVVAYRARGNDLPSELQGGWLRPFPQLEEALAQGPAGAVVSNVTSAHVEVSLAAARAGCHLLIEKPVSHCREGLEELAAEVNRRRLTVLAGFQFRFHPALRQVRQLLCDGAIGAVKYAHAHWGEYLPGWHPGEDYRTGYSARADLGGGALLTLCHPFDYLRWLLGEVSWVTAQCARLGQLEIDVEDTANVLLEFETGARGFVHLDFLQSPPTHYLEIAGEEGTIRWDAHQPGWWMFRRGRERQVFETPAGFERNHMFMDEMRHFLECLEGRARPEVTLQDGIRALAITLAAKESAREQRPVRVQS